MRARTVLVLGLLACACPWMPSSCSSLDERKQAERADATSRVDRARRALAAGDPHLAVLELQPIEDRSARDAGLQMLLGEARLVIARERLSGGDEAGYADCRAAERNFDRAASARPRDPGPWIARARACALERRDAEAVAHATRAEALLPGSTTLQRAAELASFHLARAARCSKAGDALSARASASAALRCRDAVAALSPDEDPHFVRLRNEALILLGRGEEAVALTAETIAGGNANEALHRELERCAGASGGAADLTAIYDELERRSPCFETYWYAGRHRLEHADDARVRGALEAAREDYRSAAEDFERCGELDPSAVENTKAERARALSGAAWCAFDLGDLEEAAPSWMAALRCSPALAAVGDVADRTVLEGLEAVAKRWAATHNEARARALLSDALDLASALGDGRARWLERIACWSRQGAIEAQRAGRSEEARELFARSRSAYARSASLCGDPASCEAVRLRVDAAAIALYHLVPALALAQREELLATCEAELRSAQSDLAARGADAPATQERNLLLADVEQHLGHLKLEHRGDAAAAREAFAACLAADPERAHSPQVRWYLERLDALPKEQHR